MDSVSVDRLDVDRIWSGALKVLGEVGLEIGGSVISQALAGKSLRRDGRVRIPAKMAESYADEIRQRFGEDTSASAVTRPKIYNLPLNPYWLDPADGHIKPNDTETVIRNTRLVRQLAAEELVGGSVAGVPSDAPAEMQFLMVNYIDCITNPTPGSWSLMHSRRSMEYIFEVADVMGLSKSIYAEPISPLKFGGQSVDLAVEFGRKGLWIGVDPMPVLGVTAPGDWHMAWSQSVAENLGAYVIFRECGIEGVQPPSFRLFPPNPSACTPYFSSPRHIMALLMRRKVREFFGLSTNGGELMLVASKAPDQQAAIEKTAGCVLGKVHGFAHLEGAGMLWMDEIFSPQQFMIDIEITHFVESVGCNLTEPEADIVSVMEQGLESGGFLSSDLALDRFREFAWESSLFDLSPRGSWKGDSQSFLDHAAQLAQAKTAAYTYELTDHRREALDAIIARARAEFG